MRRERILDGQATVLFPDHDEWIKEPSPVLYLIGEYMLSHEQEILTAYRRYAAQQGEVSGQPRCLLVCVPSADSASECTPWPAPPLRAGERAFGGGADAFLDGITKRIKPYLDRHYPVCTDPAAAGIAGYSLGGLLSVYALFHTAVFGAAASMSGSLWYDGWEDFLATHEAVVRQPRLYLSLGSKEKLRGSQRMRAVQQGTEKTCAYFRAWAADPGRIELVLHPGGHFHQMDARYAAAIYTLSTGMRQDLGLR